MLFHSKFADIYTKPFIYVNVVYYYMKNLSLQGLSKSLELQYPVSLDVVQEGNTIYLDKIVVEEGRRSLGYGSEVMQRIIEYADMHHLLIKLTPSDYYGGKVRKLKKFYRRFNFKKANDRLYALVRIPHAM